MSDEVVVGIEIHQQLDTRKLFCDCECGLVDEEGASFVRRLRPAQSEMGEIDRAALMEAKKERTFVYQAPRGASCLVEADEEPPHEVNRDAMDAALTMSRLMGCRTMDEVHFMRKIVIDGSNTSGFQRTALVSMDGAIQVDGRSISIQSVCLEEDAARKVSTEGDTVTYRLDRLGIPLIEIATGPDIRSPEEARLVAQRIGSLLRATKRVKRGIGTIREDVNISIPGGARIEIKGVQELRMLPLYVETEIQRQKFLLRVREILNERGVETVEGTPVDVTDLFVDSGSKVIKGAMKRGGGVLALRLPGFAGTLRSEDGSLRLGSEIAQRARTRGVKGVFHTDELPAYGIGDDEVMAVRDALELGPTDAYVLCAAQREVAESALDAVLERAREALVGVPEETRDPMQDGTSRYSRPLPGAARMYPETDVPPTIIDPARLARVDGMLPELPEAKASRFVETYGIHPQQADQIVRDGTEDVFERLAGMGMASLAASTLLGTFTEMERAGADLSSLEPEWPVPAFEALSDGRFAKEALPEVLGEMAKGSDIDSAIEALGLGAMGSDEAESIVRSIVSEREDFVRSKGMGAVGPLMGVVMSELRGKVDGKEASEILRRCITDLVS